MQAKYKILMGLGAVAGVGLLAYGYYKRQADLLMKYETAISGIKLVKASLDQVTMEFLIRFRSKANIEATIEHVYGEMFVNGVSVGFFNEVTSFIVPAKGETDIPISVTFSPKKVLKNVTDFLLGAIKNQDLPILIKGFATIKSSFIRINMPYEYNTTIKSYLSE